MGDSLTNIQSDARHYANDANLVITSAEGLRIANLIYQGMLTDGFRLGGVKIGRRWPEATREDTSLTSVASQEQYTWPTSTVFKRTWFIEYLDASSSNYPYPLREVPDILTWTAYDASISQTGIPIYWRLLDVSGTVKMALRPNPDTTGDTIRITGLIEATEFTDGTSTTVFLNNNADRALSIFIAADYKAKRGQSERALELISEGVGLLPHGDSTPVLRTGGYLRPWCV